MNISQSFPYCIVNTHNDVLAVLKFSETAQTACMQMNVNTGNLEFSVDMTYNHIKS